MNKHHKIQWTLGVAAALCAAPAAWAITPPGTPPTFYCDADRPANADTVEAQLNTRAVSATDPDRGNQPRWEYASQTYSNPGSAAAPDPLATGLTWNFFTGHEIDRYLGFAPQPGRDFPSYPGLYVGHYPAAGTPQLLQFHTHYFRYRFDLAPTVDPATYQLTLPAGLFTAGLPNLRADDNVVGVYLNGKRIYGVSTLTSALVLGGGATADEQWKTGANELTFAVQNTSVGGAVWLGIQSAQQTTCNVRAVPVTPVTPTTPGNVTAVPTLGGAGLGLLGGLLGAAAVWRRRRK